MSSDLWFKHYADSLTSNTKLKALVRKYGAFGYAAYFALLEALYRNNGNPVTVFDAESLARDLKISPRKMIEILDYAAGPECDFLIQSTADGYESNVVSAVIKHNRKTAMTRKSSARIAAQARWRARAAKEC